MEELYRLFNEWCWSNWTSVGKNKKRNLDLNFLPYTKFNSKQIMNLNVKQIKLLEKEKKNRRKSLGPRAKQ